MAAQDFNRTAPFGAIAIHNFISSLEKLASGVNDWNTRRKTIATLNALSDHELEDIGLYRSEIHQIAARFGTQR